MGLPVRQVKSAADAAKGWTNGVSGGGTAWQNGVLNPSVDPFNPANIDPDAWVQGVTAPTAKDNYASGMANTDIAAFTATVKGAGTSKYTASATTKAGKYAAFSAVWQPKLATILSNVNQANPRGPRGSAQNKSRQNAYFDATAATRGQN